MASNLWFLCKNVAEQENFYIDAKFYLILQYEREVYIIFDVFRAQRIDKYVSADWFLLFTTKNEENPVAISTWIDQHAFELNTC